MTTTDVLIDRYFSAWNAHDADGIAGVFAPDGTYEDPTTRGAIGPAALGDVARGLWAAFPDLRFEVSSRHVGETQATVEWVMRGTNHGPFISGVEPAGATASLQGVDVFTVADGCIRRIRGYFDREALAEALGLMVIVQPSAQGPATFGYSMRVASGPSRPPGVIALTWIQGADEDEKARIRGHARHNVRDFLAEPGFISIVTGFTGLRGFTVTAWEDEAAMSRGLATHHAVAMDELFTQPFVAAVWTSVWQPSRINRIWVRCTACASLQDVTDDHRACTACQASLPERPAFW